MKIAGGGFVTEEAKVQTINGVEVGVVEGYIASKAIEDNQFPDEFRGDAVFGESIQEHRARGNRPIRFHYMHQRDQQIGMFPIESVKENPRGLFGVGHINLGLQKGQEVYALARQGAISDFSIGFFIPSRSDYFFEEQGDKEVRVITKATILEGSLVDEPMNKDARVTGVKAEEQITIERLADMTTRELEECLKESGLFSRDALRKVVSECKGLTRREDSDVLSDVAKAIRAMRAPFENARA